MYPKSARYSQSWFSWYIHVPGRKYRTGSSSDAHRCVSPCLSKTALLQRCRNQRCQVDFQDAVTIISAQPRSHQFTAFLISVVGESIYVFVAVFRLFHGPANYRKEGPSGCDRPIEAWVDRNRRGGGRSGEADSKAGEAESQQEVRAVKDHQSQYRMQIPTID